MYVSFINLDIHHYFYLVHCLIVVTFITISLTILTQHLKLKPSRVNTKYIELASLVRTIVVASTIR